MSTATVTTGTTTVTESYLYDWAGTRTAKITDGVLTYYLVDTAGVLSQVLAELDHTGALITHYTRGEELISLSRPGEKHYYLHDGHGSVRALSDADGQVTDTYLFDAFGNLLSKTGTTANDFLYTGEQYDISTGFYYLRARYMNPSTGTFTSPDAYAGTIFDPVLLHKYLYANANPVMNRDPSGYQTLTLTETGTKIAIIGILAAAVILPVCINLVSRQGVGYTPINVSSITDGMVIDNTWEEIWIDVRIRDEILGDLTDRFIRTDSDYDDYGYPDDYSTSEPVGHGNGNAPRNNKDQNDQFDRICKKLNLTKKRARRLHDEITNKGYGPEEIEAIARSMFGL